MTDGSITHWIRQVKEGSASDAEQGLWDHYFPRLAALARQQLHDLPPHLRDDEDLALSALNSFFVKAKQDGFPRLRDRMELWQLLARITVRKTLHQRRGIRTHKRGGRHANSDRATDLNNLAAQEPTPAMLAAINDECQRLMGTLTEELRWVARLKLEGYTNREIATALGRVERTVERKLDRIRQTWIEEVESS